MIFLHNTTPPPCDAGIIEGIGFVPLLSHRTSMHPHLPAIGELYRASSRRSVTGRERIEIKRIRGDQRTVGQGKCIHHFRYTSIRFRDTF